MIPKKIFTYWEGNQLSELHFFTLYSICKLNPNIEIIIYTSLIESNKLVEWKSGEHGVNFIKCLNLNELVELVNTDNKCINIIKIDFEKEYNLNNSMSCVHKADLVRIIKLYEHGGIWFDMDILFISKLPEFLFNDNYELFLFSYWDTIPTGFIASTPKNKLMTLLYNGVLDFCKNNTPNSYQIVGPDCWNHYYKNFCANDSNIKILSNEYVYPFDWLTINDFFYSNDDSYIKENTFGIHWYNGSQKTKLFINSFDKNNINPGRNVCEKILNKIIESKLNKIEVDNEFYQNRLPYPYMMQDNFLDRKFALQIQNEILNIEDNQWDRYDNPFEQKYTLRDKFNFPPGLTELFKKLTEDEFVNRLSNLVGYKLKLDTTRNFWGIHSYKSGDKLDIHADAGYHPTLGLKKQVTLGIYLSYGWEEEYGCELEIWQGDNCSSNDAKIYEKIDSICPLFNRLIIFTCNDYSWHGNPVKCLGSEESRRIFITLSYLSDNNNDLNKRVKAFFVSRPEDSEDEEKDKLRLLRADPERYKEIYRTI
jgi:Rps23 Pro-64 3,4-dihydroxylase Tpa1-like proline 4-hydroxylase